MKKSLIAIAFAAASVPMMFAQAAPPAAPMAAPPAANAPAAGNTAAKTKVTKHHKKAKKTKVEPGTAVK